MNIVNEVVNPNKESSWRLNVNDVIITDEQTIADTFNKFFIEKISLLKQGIDKSNIEDPLERLSKKMSNSKLKFRLEKVS